MTRYDPEKAKNTDCAGVRETLLGVARHIANVASVPDFDSDERDSFEALMGDVIAEGQKFFLNKPATCEMVCEGDDDFSCVRCSFGVDFDVDE